MPPLVPRFDPPSPPRVPPPSPLPPPSPMGDSEVFCDASFNVTVEFVLPTTVNDVCATTREAATPPALMDDGVLCHEKSRGMRLFYQFRGVKLLTKGSLDTDFVDADAAQGSHGFSYSAYYAYDDQFYDGFTGITIMDLCGDRVLSQRTDGSLTTSVGPQVAYAYHVDFPDQPFLLDVTLIDPNDIPEWMVIGDVISDLMPEGSYTDQRNSELALTHINDINGTYPDLLKDVNGKVPIAANPLGRCKPNFKPDTDWPAMERCSYHEGYDAANDALAQALHNGGTSYPYQRTHSTIGASKYLNDNGVSDDLQNLSPVVGDALADFTGNGEYNAVIVSGAAVANRVYPSYSIGPQYLPLGGAGNAHLSSGLATYAFEDTDGDGRLESPRRLPFELGDLKRAAVVANLDAQDEVYLNGDPYAPAHLLGDAASPTVAVQIGLLDPVGQPLVATILLFKRDVNAHELYTVTNNVLDPTAGALPAVPATASGSRRRLAEDAGEVVDASLIDATADGRPDLFVVTKGGALRVGDEVAPL